MRERGQASVELLGSVPALLVLGLVVFQVFAVGYASSQAGAAAEAGALAVAARGDPVEAARQSVPGWSRAHMRVERKGGRVSVEMRPPLAIPGLAEQFEVRAEAAVEEPG